MQTKLLRFLQSGEFQKIGENKVLKSDVRVIAATNVDLLHAIEIGEFREDLYYRLNVINLEIPPLRNRPDDISVLSEYFLKKFGSRENRSDLVLSLEAVDALKGYHFPGNVRELGNLLERAVLLCPGSEILATGLNLQNNAGEKTTSGKLKDSVGGLEVDLIKNTLAEAGGNQSECARRLGISERVLRYKLQKYHLK